MARDTGLGALFTPSYRTGDPEMDALFGLIREQQEPPELKRPETRSAPRGAREQEEVRKEQGARGRVKTAVNKDLSPEARALLDTIAGDESPDYRTVYGGRKVNDLSRHPGIAVPIHSGPNAGKTSSAAGRYQFLGSTWNDQAKKLGLHDFSPESQDLAAWNLAVESYGPNLEADLRSGDPRKIAEIGHALRRVWTSLPGGIEQGAQASKFASRYLSNLGAESEAPQQASPQLASTQESPYYPVRLTDGQIFDVEKGMGLDEVDAMLQKNGINARPLRPYTAPDGRQFDVEYDMTDDEVMGMLQKAPQQPGQEEESNYLGAGKYKVQEALSGIAQGAGTELGELGKAAEGAGFLGDYAKPVSEFIRGEGEQLHAYGEQLGKEIEGTYQRPKNLNWFEENITYPAWETATGMAPYIAAGGLSMVPGVGGVLGPAAVAGAVHAGAMGEGEQLAKAEGKEFVPSEYRFPYAATVDAANLVGWNVLNKALKVFGKEAILGSREAITAAMEKGGIEEAKKVVGSRLKNVAGEFLKGEAALVSGEVIEDAINREYLGKPLLDEEAGQQYLETFKQVGPLGLFTGPMAGLGAHYNKATEVARIEEQADVAEKLEAQEMERAKAENLANIGVTPEQLEKFKVKNELEGLSDEDALAAYKADQEAIAQRKAAKIEELPEELRDVPYKEAKVYQQMQEAQAAEVPSEEVSGVPEEPAAPVEPASGVTPPAAEMGAPEVPKAPEVKAEAPEVKAEAPEVKAPEAEVPYYDTLGLKNPKSNLPYKALKQFDINNPDHAASINTILDEIEKKGMPRDQAAVNAVRAKTEEVKLNAQPIPEAGPTVRSGSAQPEIRQEGGDQTVSSQGVEPEGPRVEVPEVPEAKAPEVEAVEVEAPKPTTVKPQEPIEAWDSLRTADQPDFASLSKPAQKLWKDEYKAYEGMVDKDAVADVVKFDAGEKEVKDITVAQYGAEPTPKEELVDRALKRISYREKTGEDVWVPGLGNKQVQATLRKNLAARNEGKISEEQLLSRLNSLLDQETIKAAERRYRSKDRVRGPDFIRQKLLEAKRRGDIGDRAADLGEWLVKKNPELFEDLGISIKGEAPAGMEGASGFYNKLNRVATLVVESAKDTTAVHEMLHHTERLMPPDVRLGIHKAWLKAALKARAEATKKGDTPLTDMLDAALLGDPAKINATLRGLKPEQISEHYKHSSPSEFWAVHGTDILENRFNSSPTFLKRLANWLREFKEHVKSKLGMRSDAPILKAIDVLLKQAKPEYTSERLLGEEVGKKETAYVAERGASDKEELAEAEKRLKDSGMVGAVKNRTLGTKMRDVMNDLFTEGRSNSFVSEYVDVREPISKAVQDLPDNVGEKLRSDYIYSAYEQRGNVIQESYRKGFVAMGRDGTIEVVKDNQLALAEIFKRVGAKNQELFSNVLVALRVRTIRAQDAEIRAQANKLLNMAEEMQDYASTLKDAAKRKKFNAAARSLTKIAEKNQERIQYEKGRTEYTDKQVKDAETVVAGHPELAREAENVYALLRKSVDLWESDGLIDADKAKEWKEYPNYFPLYKVAEYDEHMADPAAHIDSYAGMMGKSPKNLPTVHAQERHAHQVFVEDNLLRHISFFASAAAEHSARKNTAYNLEMVGKAERIKKGTEKKGELVVKFRENGKDVFYRVDDAPAYYAMQSAMPLMSPLLKRMRSVGNFARGVMIMNPLFWYRQAFREPIQASLVGRAGVISTFDTLGAVSRIASGSAVGYERLRAKGVIGPVDIIPDPAEFIKVAQKGKSMVAKGLTGIKHVHEAMDAATRVVVYEKAKADALSKGFDEETADAIGVMKAREIINFAKQGRSKMVRAARATTPFFGAALNSLDVMARAAFPSKIGHLSKAEAMEARRNFYSTAFMLATFSTAYAAAMSEDEDYLKEPDRIGNWLIPIGGGKFIKIPIPFEAGWFTKELPELTMLLNMGAINTREALTEARKGFTANVLPPMVTIYAFQPFLEIAADHDFFTGSSLEGRDSEVAVRDRNSKSGELTKAIINKMEDAGINIFGMSANQLEHLNKKFLGQLWAVTRTASDAYINRGRVTPEKELTEMPLISGAVTSGTKDRAVDQFYTVAREVSEVNKSFERAKSHADVERFNQITTNPENVKALKASKSLRDKKADIGKLATDIEKIKQSQPPNYDKMSDREKKQAAKDMAAKIKMLKDRQRLIAKLGVEEARKLGLDI